MIGFVRNGSFVRTIECLAGHVFYSLGTAAAKVMSDKKGERETATKANPLSPFQVFVPTA